MPSRSYEEPLTFKNIHNQYVILTMINFMSFNVGFSTYYNDYKINRESSYYSADDNIKQQQAYAAGILLGNIFYTCLRIMLGLRQAIYVLVIPNVSFWLIVAMANNAADILYAKYFAGVIFGGVYVTIPLFVGEFADRRCRGSIIALWVLLGIIGKFMQQLFHTALPVYIGFAWLQFLFVLIWYYTPESPLQLLRSNDHERAEAAYIFYNRGNRRPDETDYGGEARLAGAMHRLAEYVRAERKLRRTMHPLREIGLPQNIRAIGLAVSVPFVYFFGGMVHTYGIDSLDDSIHSVGMNSVQLLCAIVTLFLVDRMRRRRLLLFASALCLVSFSLLGMSTFWQITHYKVAINEFQTICTVGIEIGSTLVNLLMCLLMSELLVNPVRELSLTVATMFVSFLRYATSSVFDVVRAYLGFQWWILIHCVVCALGVCFALFVFPETLGVDLYDTENFAKVRTDYHNEQKTAAAAAAAAASLRPLSSSTEESLSIHSLSYSPTKKKENADMSI